MLLVNRFADCVLDCFFAGLIHRTPYGVVDCALMFLVDRFANGVINRARFGFIGWNHHGVINVACSSFRHKPTALHFTVLVVNLVSSAIASLLNSIVNRLSYGSHASVSSSSHRSRGHFITISGLSASTTALIADRTTICGARGICTGHDRTDHDGGYDPQPIHLDFSKGNNTSVARRSFGDHGASAHMSRHRSSCSFRHK